MRRSVLWVAVAGAAFATGALPAAGSQAAVPAGPAKACKAGYRHAVIAGTHKCLKAGQLCVRRLDRTYHRYKFHCHAGRLTRVAPPKPKPTPSADVSVTKTVSAATLTVGVSVTYRLTVTNRGPNAAGAVVLSDVLPGALTLQGITVDNPGAAGCSGTSTVTCSLGALASGASVAFSLVVRTTTAGTVLNTATVSSPTRDPNAANNSSTATTTVAAVPRHALTVQKAGSGGGTVVSTPAGIDCGATCTATFPAATVVTLTATEVVP